MRAIVRIGFAKAEQASAIPATQRRKQIVEANANESWSLNQIYNRTDTLTDCRIGFGESLMNTGVRRDHVAHLIVFEANDCVGDLVETAQSFACLGVATPAFERKRQCCECKNQRACLASEMRHIRRCTRSRAAPEACADEDHSCTAQRFADLLCRFERGLIAKLRIATCTQATGDSATELYFVCRNGARQRLHVGVDGEDFCSLQSVEHDPVERIQTGATNTDNFDWNKFLRPLGEAVIFAELNHIVGTDCRRRPRSSICGAPGGRALLKI